MPRSDEPLYDDRRNIEPMTTLRHRLEGNNRGHRGSIRFATDSPPVAHPLNIVRWKRSDAGSLLAGSCHAPEIGGAENRGRQWESKRTYDKQIAQGWSEGVITAIARLTLPQYTRGVYEKRAITQL